MTWVESAPTVLSLVALLYLPGLGFGLLAGLRGVVLVGAAPAVTATTVGATAFLADRVGLGWGMLAYLLGTALTLGVGALLGWWRRRTGTSWAGTVGPALDRLTVVGLGVAWSASALVAILVLRTGIGAPDALLQTWDSVFHLNAVQAIRELGNASLLGGLNSLSGPDAPTLYYPSVWHALVALAPGSVPVAANASTVVMACVVWPLGIAALARVVVPSLPLVTLAAPVVGASFLAFPTVLLSTSGQWPNGLSVALLPGALAVAAFMLRSWTDSGVSGFLVALPALAGVALVHASGAFAMLYLLVPLVVGCAVSGAVRLGRAGRWRWVVGGAAVTALLVGVMAAVLSRATVLQNTVNYPRPASGTVVDGLWDGLLDVPMVSDAAGNAAVLALVMVGCVAALVRREARWLVVGWAVCVALVALATGPENDLRWLTGFWYKSVPRVAALVPVAASVLGGLGAVWLGHLAARATARLARDGDRPAAARHVRASAADATTPAADTRAADTASAGEAPGREARAPARPAVATIVAWAVPAVLLLGAWAATDGFRHDDKVHRMAQGYDPDQIRYGALVSHDEVDLLRSLEDVLPDDAVLLGDPFNGAAYAYAVSGVDVTIAQLGAAFASPAQQYLERHFRDIRTDPQVCEYVRELGVTHFYADEPAWIEGTDVAARWPGLYGVDVSEGFELVASAGGVGVYAVSACD